MITVLRASGLSVVIFAHDHEPPHVHVVGDGSAKILLVGHNGWPEIIRSQGMNKAEQRRALRAVRAAQLELLEYWKQIHG